MSAQHQRPLPFSNDEVNPSDVVGQDSSATSASRPTQKAARAPSSSSAAGLSSSFSLPSRSYIHHAGHGAQGRLLLFTMMRRRLTQAKEPMQYSSSGVREQTAELSSSFLSDSDISRQFNQQSPRRRERLGSDFTGSDWTSEHPRRHDPIEERSEPQSPEGTSPTHEQAPASNLTELLRTSPPFNPVDTPSTGHERESNRQDSQSPMPEVVIQDEDEDDDMPPTEISPLLPRERLSSNHKASYNEDLESQPAHKMGTWSTIDHVYPSLRNIGSKAWRTASNPKSWNMRKLGHAVVVKPVKTLPAVFLGVLLNLLDALSYGIILFPLGEEAFADMGPDGVSMFYVSCIIAQLVYSTGSIFRGGVGSEMVSAFLVLFQPDVS